jgi:hypothetical protein
MDKLLQQIIRDSQGNVQIQPHLTSAAQKKLRVKAEPPKTKSQLLFQGQKHPKKQKKIVRLEQWVEVRIDYRHLARSHRTRKAPRGRAHWPHRRRQTVDELACPSGGASSAQPFGGVVRGSISTAPVLRVFLKRGGAAFPGGHAGFRAGIDGRNWAREFVP